MKWHDYLHSHVRWRGMYLEAAVHWSSVAMSFALVATLAGAWHENTTWALGLWTVSQVLMGISAYLLVALWRAHPEPHPDDAGHRGFAIGLAVIIEMLAIAVVVSIAFFR